MAINVALAGATGNLGPSILTALLDAHFNVTILSRKGSKSTESIAAHSNQRIINVDYDKVEDLESALQGVDVVVSTVASEAIKVQHLLIQAAVKAGVKRFIPGDFGSDIANPDNRKLPVYKDKIDVADYLHQKTQSNPWFSYTLAYNNLFLDWGIEVGFLLNAKEHQATVYDGGNHPISMTTRSSIGRAVVGIINNLDATRNRVIYYHDGAFTQNQLIGLIKEIDGRGWSLKQVSTKDIENDAYTKLEKGEDIGAAMMGFIVRAALGKDNKPDYTGRTENELLGLKELTEEELIEVLKREL